MFSMPVLSLPPEYFYKPYDTDNSTVFAPNFCYCGQIVDKLAE